MRCEMDTNQLWKDRLNQHIKLTSRYLKLIFNDHLAFALIFFIAAFAFFYQNFLQTVPPDFPVAWIMAIVLGLLVATRSIRTFFKEADEVYLLAVENRMRPYIIKSFIYSLVGRSYTIALALFA